jgi:hypothetical protein
MQKPVIVDAVCIDFHSLSKQSPKTSVINAVTKTGEAFSDFPNWLKDAIKDQRIYIKPPSTWNIIVKTPFGELTGHIGDYIVKNKDGQLSIWKGHVFEERFAKLL